MVAHSIEPYLDRRRPKSLNQPPLRSLSIVLRLELRRWDVANRPQQPPRYRPDPGSAVTVCSAGDVRRPRRSRSVQDGLWYSLSRSASRAKRKGFIRNILSDGGFYDQLSIALSVVASAFAEAVGGFVSPRT